MNFLCFGSLNIDYVYHVEHICAPGETVAGGALLRNSGGKGLNQSAALAKAGVHVFHAGKIGPDGAFLREKLEGFGADTSLISEDPSLRTGHAIIQVDKNGQNSILLYGGANRAVGKPDFQRALEHFGEGDMLVIQNEISNLRDLMLLAKGKHMKIAFNASPIDKYALTLPYDKTDVLIVNESEGEALTGETDYDRILGGLEHIAPKAVNVLTAGENGSMARFKGITYRQCAYKTKVRDTTAAGDTFLGYFLSSFENGIAKALDLASRASAVTVSRTGAAESIPYLYEIE